MSYYLSNIKPWRVAGSYLLLALVWVMLSDYWVSTLPVAWQPEIQSIKGSLFIALSTLLLWWLLRRACQRIGALHASLQTQEQNAQALIDNLQDPVFRLTADGRILYISNAIEPLRGKAAAALVGCSFAELFAQEDAFTRLRAALLCANGSLTNFILPLPQPGGASGWAAVSCHFVVPQDADAGEIEGVIRDITSLKSHEEELRLAATVFQSTTEGIMITDAGNRILAVNAAFTRITGYAAAEVIGRPPSLLSSQRHSKDFYAQMWQTLQASDSWQGEIWNRDRNGHIYPEWLCISVVRDEQAHITHYIAAFSDISRIKRSEEQVAQLVHYDPLTGLPNRLLLNARLKHALEAVHRNRQQVAVLFLDLDGFKTVNDSLGHGCGDELLKLTAQRLKHGVRKEDTVARLGGDEFVIILTQIEQRADAEKTAAKLLHCLAEPFVLNQQRIFVTGSVGISYGPEQGHNIELLIRNADSAMYVAKAQGRNRFSVYNEQLTSSAREKLDTVTRLRDAIHQEALFVLYQPQVDLASGRLISAEALVRWRLASGEVVPPDRFIPLAEEAGLIADLGYFVLRTACRQMVSWRRDGLALERVCVNVSARQLQDEQLLARVAQILEETGCRPQWLELEMTETSVMEQSAAHIATLHALRALGIGLAIDDFGTGYSSLSYLRQLPFDVLKIDRSFVASIGDAAADEEIASAIIGMAHSRKLRVVAEGVETEPQAAFLRTRGCDLAQGYLYGRPQAAQQLRLEAPPTA